MLLRHPLPLQPPSLALLLPPSHHPAPALPQCNPPPPLLLPLPQMHFPPFSPPLSPLSRCFHHLVFTPYSLALELSLLLLHEHSPPPHTHSVPFPFFLTNLLLMCVYIPPSHSFNSVSLSVLSEGLSWKRLPPTHSLFSVQLHIRFTFTMSKRSISHVALAHGYTCMWTLELVVCTCECMCRSCEVQSSVCPRCVGLTLPLLVTDTFHANFRDMLVPALSDWLEYVRTVGWTWQFNVSPRPCDRFYNVTELESKSAISWFSIYVLTFRARHALCSAEWWRWEAHHGPHVSTVIMELTYELWREAISLA